MQILETDRLVLRHLERGDLDDLYALYADPEIRRYFPDGTLTREETLEELEWFTDGHPEHPQLGLWATIHKPSGRFIGRCGLLPWTIEGRPEVEVAYLLAQAYWGQGLATEAATGDRPPRLRAPGLLAPDLPDRSGQPRVDPGGGADRDAPRGERWRTRAGPSCSTREHVR